MKSIDYYSSDQILYIIKSNLKKKRKRKTSSNHNHNGSSACKVSTTVFTDPGKARTGSAVVASYMPREDQRADLMCTACYSE